MNSIYDIRFSFEQKVKDEVISKFATKQGGAFSVFSYQWQCFVWAAVIGFIKNKRLPLKSPLADKPFDMNTMLNTQGEKAVQALISMCIAKADNLDILKEPEEAIKLINEYANGGFYEIIKMMEDDPMVNDFDWVKREVFSR